MNIQNTWVVDSLNLPKYELNHEQLKYEFPHLKNVDFSLPDNSKVSILIGADVPELHICCDVKQVQKKQPIAILSPLGWVLMGGIALSNEILKVHLKNFGK